MTEKNSNEITAKILNLGSMIDGLDIAIARTKELLEKFCFNYEPFESSEGLTFSLDTLRETLLKDRAELKEAMKELQKRL